MGLYAVDPTAEPPEFYVQPRIIARTREVTRAVVEIKTTVQPDKVLVSVPPAETAQIDRVLDEFEKTAWAGLEPDRYAWAAVQHSEAAGGVHVHVLAARCDLETGKSLSARSESLRTTR